eukprot:3027630-Pleurochrysis_carterae.AAC.2
MSTIAVTSVQQPAGWGVRIFSTVIGCLIWRLIAATVPEVESGGGAESKARGCQNCKGCVCKTPIAYYD